MRTIGADLQNLELRLLLTVSPNLDQSQHSPTAFKAPGSKPTVVFVLHVSSRFKLCQYNPIYVNMIQTYPNYFKLNIWYYLSIYIPEWGKQWKIRKNLEINGKHGKRMSNIYCRTSLHHARPPNPLVVGFSVIFCQSWTAGPQLQWHLDFGQCATGTGTETTDSLCF
jgi:hypothetical protein